MYIGYGGSSTRGSKDAATLTAILTATYCHALQRTSTLAATHMHLYIQAAVEAAPEAAPENAVAAAE